MDRSTEKQKTAIPVSESNLGERIDALSKAHGQLCQACDLEGKARQVAEIDTELAKGWDAVDDPPGLQRTRARLQSVVDPLRKAGRQLDESRELLQLAAAESDAELLGDIGVQLDALDRDFAQLKLGLLLSHPYASEDCYLDIHFGSGGVESQDWAQMLKRMYIGHANERCWRSSVIEETPGEAGIKSVTLLIEGMNAYGMLRTESGIHRLVRKSPFDSNHRRHTTFASVFVYPVLPEEEAPEINPADLRIDTYRSSGAGGQHVNTTDSAVRITHLPTGIVVQCQNDRSQHKNKSTAMSMLSSRLELLSKEAEAKEKQKLEASKADISWGEQIRSYVLDQARIKDLRTGLEVGNPQAVLDGDLHRFIEASLNAGI